MIEQPKNINTFAVDADIVAYRCAAVCEEEDIKELCATLDEFLYNIVRETGISRLALFLSDQTNFRYKLAKTKPYKGNRDKIIRPRHIFTANAYLKDMYKAMVIENYEADDAVASYMTQHKDVAHAGIDKDIKQIMGYHYDVVKRIWTYTSPEESTLKLYRQVCQGDTSDNIPGLPSIGEKKAEKAITNHFKAKDQALAFYQTIMKQKSQMTTEEIITYFNEQESLIMMVDTLEIPYECYTVVAPPKLFEESADPEDDFVKVEESPKPSLVLT